MKRKLIEFSFSFLFVFKWFALSKSNMLSFDGYQILGDMKKNPQSLMLITVIKNLQRLGYVVKVVVLKFQYGVYYLCCWW
jgi:hypothetical protein